MTGITTLRRRQRTSPVLLRELLGVELLGRRPQRH
jgi:hypothetical protein